MRGQVRGGLSKPLLIQLLHSSQCLLLISFLAIVMVGSVTMPMFDMEAKISQTKFILFNHPINFENQVHYFQTKSVLDVFWIIRTDESIELKFVGILMVGFSVFFPLVKMVSSVIYFYDLKGLKKNTLIKYFVLKSGKWSMADIGFNGIIIRKESTQ